MVNKSIRKSKGKYTDWAWELNCQPAIINTRVIFIVMIPREFYLPINPAIQLGDGGTGITTEVNTFYFFDSKKTIGLYGNFYYLINPRDINGTQYTMGKPLDPFMLQIGAYENSVPDVFSFRAGVDINLSQLGIFSRLKR